MKEIFQWISKAGEKCQYHFINGIFVKFTIEGEPQEETNKQYKGKELSDDFKNNLKLCGFKKL